MCLYRPLPPSHLHQQRPGSERVVERMLQWLGVWRTEVSDGGERTKEDRLGDSLVMCKSERERHSSLTAPPAAGVFKLQRETCAWGGGREGKEEYDYDPEWSLQHDCLAFSQGIKEWQGQAEKSACVFFFFFFLVFSVLLCHVLIWTRTNFCLLLCKCIQWDSSFHLNSCARVAQVRHIRRLLLPVWLAFIKRSAVSRWIATWSITASCAAMN